MSLAELNTATRRTKSPDSTLSSNRSTCSGASLMPTLSSAMVTSPLALAISSRLRSIFFLASSMSLPRLSTVSVTRPGSTPSLGAPICFSRSLTMWSSSSRMFLRRPSIFFCTSTTGTSVTMPRAASRRSRIFFSRSSLVSVHSGFIRKSFSEGSFLASARFFAASCRIASTAFMRRCACSKLGSPSRGSFSGAEGVAAGGGAAAGGCGPAGDWASAGVTSARRLQSNATVEIERPTLGMVPRTSQGIRHPTCSGDWGIFVARPSLLSAVHPGVSGFDKIKQISVHLSSVGQHHHVRNGRTRPAHAGCLQLGIVGPVAQVEAEPQLRGQERDGRKLAGRTERDVTSLRADDEANYHAADFRLQHLIKRPVALTRGQQPVEIGELARARRRLGCGRLQPPRAAALRQLVQIDWPPAVAVDAVQPGGASEGDALAAQPIERLVLVGEVLGRDGGHPLSEVASRAGLKVRQKLPFLLLFVVSHVRGSPQNQRRVRPL